MTIDELGLVERLRDGPARDYDFTHKLSGYDALCTEAAATIERLLAERDEARMALKPFAEFADLYDATYLVTDKVIAHTVTNRGIARVLLADFRRARQALQDKT